MKKFFYSFFFVYYLGLILVHVPTNISAQNKPVVTQTQCGEQLIRWRAGHLGMNDDAQEKFWQTVKSSVVSIRINHLNGFNECSGVVWWDNQHILTNQHCLLNSIPTDAIQEVQVLPHSGKTLQATHVVAHANFSDAVVLRLQQPVDELKPITFENTVQPDDIVMGVPGCHHGLLGKEIVLGYSAGKVMTLPSTDGENSFTVSSNIRMFSGKSGALLINLKGEPVGLLMGDSKTSTDSFMQYKTPEKYFMDYTVADALHGQQIRHSLDIYDSGISVKNWHLKVPNKIKTYFEVRSTKTINQFSSEHFSLGQEESNLPSSYYNIIGLYLAQAEFNKPQKDYSQALLYLDQARGKSASPFNEYIYLKVKGLQGNGNVEEMLIQHQKLRERYPDFTPATVFELMYYEFVTNGSEEKLSELNDVVSANEQTFLEFDRKYNINQVIQFKD